MGLSNILICLIVCHAGPADHFEVFRENLVKEGHQIQVYAAGPAYKKFKENQIDNLNEIKLTNLSKEEEDELALKIASECVGASVVVTDVGASFDVSLQTAFEKKAPKVKRLAYYDNPEAYVPGGYSKTASKVMLAADKVLFANANLAQKAIYEEENKELILPLEKRVGIGFYPVSQAEKLFRARKQNHGKAKTDFLTKHGMQDNGQKVFVYFGGNNEEYFEYAFPSFLDTLAKSKKYSDLSNTLIVIQQHPGAVGQNRDGLLLDVWIKENALDSRAPKIIISKETTQEMLIVADAAIYYQTSMSSLFALASIPMIQVGHKVYEDTMTKIELCTVVKHPFELADALVNLKPLVVCKERRKVICNSLGVKENWLDLLKTALSEK